jgi:hypothetical protein
MDIEIKHDDENKFKNYFYDSTKARLDAIMCPYDLKIKVYHYKAVYFPEYYGGWFWVYDENRFMGKFTIQVFPHCCGVATITADYGEFSFRNNEKENDFIMLMACLLAKDYPNVIAIDKWDEANYKSYIKYGWKASEIFLGKNDSKLVYLSKNITDWDVLKDINDLFNEENKDIKQASKPFTTKKSSTKSGEVLCS